MPSNFSTVLSIASVLLAMTNVSGRNLGKAAKNTCGPIIPIEIQSVLGELETLDDEQGGSMPAEVCEIDAVGSVERYESDDGSCFPSIDGEAELNCCCSVDKKKSRSITIADPNEYLSSQAAFCPISKVIVELDATHSCDMECCDSCKCWGDPHCKSLIDNEASPGVRVRESFITCDNRYTSNEGEENMTCSSKLEISKKAKEACLQLDGCEWIGNKRGYNFNMIGGPCQPQEQVSMLMYEDEQLAVHNNMGERGVIESMSFAFKNQGGSSVLTLDSKTDCFNFYNNLNAADTPVDVSAVGNNYELAYTSSTGYDFDRKINIKSDGATTDVIWEIKKQETGLTMIVSCNGATNGANVYQGSTDFTTKSGAPSTRPDVLTRMNAAIFLAAGANVGEQDGFCKTGQYAEVNGNSLEACPVVNNLSKGDAEFLADLESCKEILRANNCEFFQPQRFKANHPTRLIYKELMQRCVNQFCEDAFEENLDSQYTVPPGSELEECRTDVEDFGASEAYDLYTRTFKKASALDAECNSYKLVYKTQSDEEFVIATGDLSTVVSAVEFIDVSHDGSVPGTYGPPKEVRVETVNCPETCASLPKLKLKVKYQTKCEELLELAGKGTTLTAGDTSVPTAKFLSSAVVA